MLKEYSWVFFCMLCALSALDAEHRLEPRRTKRIQREIQGNEWIGEVPTFADFTIDIYIGMTASYLPPNPFQPFTSHQGKIGEAMVRRYSVIPRAQRFSAIDQSTYVTAPQSGNNNYRSVGGVSRHVTFDRPAQINRDTTTQPVPTPHYELSDDPSFLSSVRYQHEIGLVYRARSTTEDPLRGPTDIKYSHTKNSETHKLNEGAEAARIAQRTWLESIRRQKNLQEETRRQYLQEAREAQEQKANEERRARHEAQEQRLLARRAIIAAQVERQRVENEAREQRILAQRAVIAAAAERRRIELEERQRVENEAREQRKLAQRAIIAAAAERHRIELEERQRVENEVRERQRLLGEEAERLRRERERECVVCLESNDIGIMVQTPCAHWYCRIHLRDAFVAAYNSRALFQCCQQAVPSGVLSDLLTADFRARYDSLQLELSTPNPVYCSNRSCGTFIPPAQARGPDNMQCSLCEVTTCRHCRNRSHNGSECVSDIQTQQVRSLALAQGWKTCPSCSNMVSRSTGCAHMTCRCGMQFCYRCGRRYGTCGNTCR